MSRRRLASSLALLVLASVHPSSTLTRTALADTVVMRNGRRIEGHVMIANDREVTIRTAGGIIMRFERRQVSSIEKDEGTAPPAPEPAKSPAEEDYAMPDGASDSELDRLRTLISQLRDTTRRWRDARKEREDAEKGSGPAAADTASRAATREKEFARTLENQKKAREAIDRSAAARFVEMQRAARSEAERLHAETDTLRAALDGAGLEDRATKLRARLPDSPRDPNRRVIQDESIYAMSAAGEVDAQRARDAKTAEGRTVGFVRAGDHFAWCVANSDGAARALAFKRATAAYADAHRAGGFRPVEVERALVALHAFKACAALVEERLTERRWGAELSENEGGQFRTELNDGRVVYGDEVPATSFAHSARERRERTEQRTTKEGGGIQTKLVKVTRWYELVWDPAKKHWSRESQLTLLESSKLIPMLNAAQDLEDAAARERADRELATTLVVDRRDALVLARRKCDQGEVQEDAVEKAAKDLAEAKTVLGTHDASVAKAQGAVEAKMHEIAELDKDFEKAKKGE